MAPSTILRSMAFSRATASAICRSSSLLALTVAIRQSPLLELTRRLLRRAVVHCLVWRVLAVARPARRVLAALAPAQRFGNESVGQDELCFHHVVDAQQNFGIAGGRI